MEWVLTREKRPEPEVLTVGGLTEQIKDLLEGRFAHVWVEGEISGCRYPRSGHIYFTLKDAQASLSCVMWRSAARRLRTDLEDGMKVLVKGPVSVYPPRGGYQLIAESIEPRGLGELQAAFEALKRALQAEGLFDAERKRPLPPAPRRIGVVTSPTGAAIRDVLSVLGRRYPLAEVVVASARVQGVGSAAEVVAGIEGLARLGGVDVIVVTRGGGSLEDLWTFNEEAVARAIVASPVPVMSAVGHEIDFTIADFVADARAPTPSAAAELLVPDGLALKAAFDTLQKRLLVAQGRHITRRRAEVNTLAGRLADPRRRLTDRRQRLAELEQRLSAAMTRELTRRRLSLTHLAGSLERSSPQARIGRERLRLDAARRSLAAQLQLALERRRLRLASAAGRLDALSPLKTLQRGFSITTSPRGDILMDSEHIEVGSEVGIRLARGALRAEVIAVEPHDG